jgi:hypothetical protein
MAIQKSILAGMDDYTGAELSDILSEIDHFISYTERSIGELPVLRLKVDQEPEKFDSPTDLIEYIDDFKNKFKRYLIELRRVRGEVGKSIENRHVETIGNLFVSSEFDEKDCRRFKNDNICRSLKDESVRPIVDRIYEVTMSVAVDYRNLSNLRACLERFVGTVFNQNESAVDTANQYIELKPNIFGIGLNLNNVIKIVPKLWNKWFKKK